ncbi:MAG: hypothetical protein ACOX9E_05870 [Lentisphaeria bacterium]
MCPTNHSSLCRLLPLLLAADCCFAAATTCYGAKVAKATHAETAAPTLLLPDGWRLREGEAFTGVNIREYFFTVEADGAELPPPRIQLSWPGVEIGEVYGGKDVVRTDDGVSFLVTAGRTPTGFTTSLPRLGAVQMGIFHNLEGMQAGAYRGKPYPATQIQAQLNYLFAARDMMREMGFADARDAVDGVINLYGFETNFPNGHVDAPPHFHIMLMWNAWKDNHVCHFILDDAGKIVRNDHQVNENGKRNDALSGPRPLGASMDMPDRSGAVRFVLHMLADGSGLEMTVPGKDKQAMIRSDNPAGAVTCYTRPNAAADWQAVATVTVRDDVAKGLLAVTRDANGRTTREEWRYDPHTGRLLTTTP